MRRGAATASAIVHLVLIAILVFGLPQFARPLAVDEPVSIEIVDVITDVANPAPAQRERTPVPPAPVTKPLPPAEVLKETPVATAPEPEVEPEPPTPPPPAPAAKPDTPAEVAEVRPPDPVKSEVPEPVQAKEPEKPKPEPAKEPEKPKPKPEKPKPEKPKPPKAKPKPEKTTTDFSDLDALLNDHTDKPTGAPPRADARPSDTPNREISNRNDPSRPLSNSERGAIIAQLEQCWALDRGAAGVDTMYVVWDVKLDRSGALIGQPVLVERSGTATPAFVDRAYRAFFKCNPLKNLPIDKYERWNSLRITFDPRGPGLGG